LKIDQLFNYLIINKGQHTTKNIGHLADSVKFENGHMDIKI